MLHHHLFQKEKEDINSVLKKKPKSVPKLELITTRKKELLHLKKVKNPNTCLVLRSRNRSEHKSELISMQRKECKHQVKVKNQSLS
jgi:hypothetical protein